MSATYFSFGDEGSHRLRCAACQAMIDLEGLQLDHHPRVCPRCGVGCAFLDWKGRILQIVPAHAPAPIRLILAFAQEHLDELEYVELMAELESLADALATAGRAKLVA